MKIVGVRNKEGQVIEISQACIKIYHGDFEISIAVDDSCGAMKVPHRADIRIYEVGVEDQSGGITEKFFPGEDVVEGNAENIKEAILRISSYKNYVK